MKMNVTLSAALLTALLTLAATSTNSQSLAEITITGTADKNAGSLNDLQTDYPRVYKKLAAAYSGLNSLTYAVNKKKLYLCFKSGNLTVRSVYDANGKMKYAVTSLGSALPVTVLQGIQKEYPGYTLCSGRHIKLPGAALYHIILENSREYLVLNYSDEEIMAVKTVTK